MAELVPNVTRGPFGRRPGAPIPPAGFPTRFDLEEIRAKIDNAINGPNAIDGPLEMALPGGPPPDDEGLSLFGPSGEDVSVPPPPAPRPAPMSVAELARRAQEGRAAVLGAQSRSRYERDRDATAAALPKPMSATEIGARLNPQAGSQMAEADAAQSSNARARARRESAAAPGGLNQPPGSAKAAASQAVASAAAPTAPPLMPDFERRSRESRDQQEAAEAKAAFDAWNRRNAELNAEYNMAVEDGDAARAAAVAREQQEHLENRPELPASVTGGLEDNEFLPVDHDGDPQTPEQSWTAADTFEQLAASGDPGEAQAADNLLLVAANAVGVPASEIGDPENRRKVDEWLSGQFGDIHPSERPAAMVAAANRQFAAGMPRPEPARGPVTEGRPKYQAPTGTPDGIGSKGDTRAGGANFASGQPAMYKSPDGSMQPIPVREGRGNRVRGGHQMTAAPQIDGMLEQQGITMEDLNSDGALSLTPPTGPAYEAWRQKMLLAGQAFGIDRTQYEEGSNGDNAYIAATTRFLREHRDKISRGGSRSEAGWEVVPDVEGGNRYAPTKQLADRREQRLLTREAEEATRGIVSLDPPDPGGKPITTRVGNQEVPIIDEIFRAAQEGDGGRMRQLISEARQKDRRVRQGNLRSARRQEADLKRTQHSVMGPAMLREDLRVAGDDPELRAQAFERFGMFDRAREARGLQTTRQALDVQREVGVAEAEAAAARNPRDKDPVATSDAVVGSSIRQRLLDNSEGMQGAAEDGTPIPYEIGLKMYIDTEYPKDGGPGSYTEDKRPEAQKGYARLLMSGNPPNPLAVPGIVAHANNLYEESKTKTKGLFSPNPAAGRKHFIDGCAEIGIDEAAAGRWYDDRLRTDASRD